MQAVLFSKSSTDDAAKDVVPLFPALQKHHEGKVGRHTMALALLLIYVQLL